MNQTSIARRVAWWSLLAMVFLVPLIMSGFSLPGVRDSLDFSSVELVKLSLILVLALIALASWATDLLRRGGRIHYSSVDWLILGWLTWVGVTTLTSLHWQTALLGAQGRYEGLVTLLCYALIYFMAKQFAREEGRSLRLAQTLLAAGAIVAIYGLLQSAGVVMVAESLPWEESGRAFSTFGHPNVLGGFLVFSVTASMALALRERQRWFRLADWGSVGLNAVALVMTFSRGAWVGTVIALLLLGVMAWRQRVKMQRIDLVPASVFGAGLIGLIVGSIWKLGATRIAERVSSIFDWSEGTAGARLEIWRAAARAIKDRPLFGFGPDTFGLVFPKFQTAEYVRSEGATQVANNAHNYPLHLAAGIGILGAVLLVACWVWALLTSFKTVFGRAGGPDRLVTGAFWAASVGYLAHLLFNISVPGTTFLLWIAFALMLAPTAKTIEVQPRRFGTAIAVIVGALSILGIAGQSVALAADRSDVIAREGFLQYPLATRIKEADRAIHLNPLVSQYRSSAAAVRSKLAQDDSIAVAQAMLDGTDTTLPTETLTQSFTSAESAYREAIDSCPYDYADYVNLASLYNLAGEYLDPGYYETAIETAELGLEVMPLGTDIRERLAEALDGVGRTEEAIEALEYCLQLYPNEYSAALSLAGLYQEQGMTDEALALLTSMRGDASERSSTRDRMLDAAIEALEQGLPLP